VRTIAVARITMPKASVRLSAGRQQMSDAIQALCFLAGAIQFLWGTIVDHWKSDVERDRALMDKLGMYPLPKNTSHREHRVSVARCLSLN